jgi:hypothetical protein
LEHHAYTILNIKWNVINEGWDTIVFPVTKYLDWPPITTTSPLRTNIGIGSSLFVRPPNKNTALFPILYQQEIE